MRECLTFSPQIGPQGHCLAAQIWDEHGRSLAQMEGSIDPLQASTDAARLTIGANHFWLLVTALERSVMMLNGALKGLTPEAAEVQAVRSVLEEAHQDIKHPERLMQR